MTNTVDDLTTLAQEVRAVIIALDAIAKAPYPLRGFGDGYKQIGINFDLRACEYAADITGYDRTFCKMLNHRFRMDAAELMFEGALAEVAA
jgi:hypothetical protein